MFSIHDLLTFFASITIFLAFHFGCIEANELCTVAWVFVCLRLQNPSILKLELQSLNFEDILKEIGDHGGGLIPRLKGLQAESENDYRNLDLFLK